jgi:hypothetical protein
MIVLLVRNGNCLIRCATCLFSIPAHILLYLNRGHGLLPGSYKTRVEILNSNDFPPAWFDAEMTT